MGHSAVGDDDSLTELPSPSVKPCRQTMLSTVEISANYLTTNMNNLYESILIYYTQVTKTRPSDRRLELQRTMLVSSACLKLSCRHHNLATSQLYRETLSEPSSTKCPMAAAATTHTHTRVRTLTHAHKHTHLHSPIPVTFSLLYIFVRGAEAFIKPKNKVSGSQHYQHVPRVKKGLS